MKDLAVRGDPYRKKPFIWTTEQERWDPYIFPRRGREEARSSSTLILPISSASVVICAGYGQVLLLNEAAGQLTR